MKKVVISLALTVCMLFGLVACGGSDKAESGIMVTIDGKEYNLAGNFKDMVGQMVGDGAQVWDSYWGGLYGENGERLPNSQGTYPEGVCVRVGNEPLNRMISPIMRQMVFLFPGENEYEAASGIRFDSAKEELENLEGYMYYNGGLTTNPFSRGEDMYYALYMDGKIVDLEMYRDEYDAWMADVNALGAEVANVIHLGDGNLYTANLLFELGRMPETQEIQMRLEDEGPSAESRILLAFAAADAGRLLESKAISSYELVEYTYVEEKGVFMYVEHYYLNPEETQYDSKRREQIDQTRQERIEALLVQ